MKTKVGVIVWAIDPEGEIRFLLRHNKPFDGYKDEWTIVFGTCEDEKLEQAAIREVGEELGINDFEKIENLNYQIRYQDVEEIEIHFFAIKVRNIDIKISLNEESIGYDWMTKEEVKDKLIHSDELAAFDKVNFLYKL